MKLYSGPLSLFTAKVRLALAEKDLPYELVPVPFGRASGYSPKHPDVLRQNPKGQVPVLTDGDLTLFDSTIILEYLEDRYPAPPLYPSDPAGRGRCRQLEASADEILFPFVWELIREVFYQPSPAARNTVAIAAAHAGIATHYDALEPRVPSDGFLCGPFTVADIGYALTATFAAMLGAPIGDRHPGLGAWYGRVLSRPTVAREIAGMQEASRTLPN